MTQRLSFPAPVLFLLLAWLTAGTLEAEGNAVEVDAAPLLEIEIPAGDTVLTEITLQEQKNDDVRFHVSWAETPSEATATFEFSDKDGNQLTRPQSTFPAGGPSPLFVKTAAGSAAEVHDQAQGRIRLARLRSGTNEVSHTFEIPVLARIVEPRTSEWTVTATFLAGVIVILYSFFLWKNTHLLKAADVAALLGPTDWYMGRPQRRRSDRQQVLRMIQSEMTPFKRILRWLFQNPLVFGFPGQQYNESLELFLAADAQRSRASLLGLRNALRRMKYRKRTPQGRLFVTARPHGQYLFFALCGKQYRIGAYSIERLCRGPAVSKSSVLLKNGSLLTKPSDDQEDGEPAGWKIIGRIRAFLGSTTAD